MEQYHEYEFRRKIKKCNKLILSRGISEEARGQK
jgi:hypothetical protein